MIKCKEPIVYACVFLCGVLLRLVQIGRQIIGDDEWHGIYIAANKSFKYIASHYQLADNCIPLTLFYKLSLNTVGLNEFMLHSLQLITGIGALILFPLITRSVLNKKTTVIFITLLAISPLLIYYSRYARPYAIVTFFSFIAIFSFYFWIKRRKLRYIIVYLVAGILAPYFSLTSTIFVITPLLYAFVWAILTKIVFTRFYDASFPRLRQFFIIGGTLISGIALWFLPTIGSLKNVMGKVSRGSISFSTIKGYLSLITGSKSSIFALLLLICIFYGFYLVYKRDKFLFGYFSAVSALQILSLYVVKPSGVQDAIVLARYTISCLPLWLLLIAMTLRHLSDKADLLIRKKGKRWNHASAI
jgi:hypothetical protein